MSSADDLRDDILLICCQVGDPAEDRLARLDALLTDPVRRLAILAAMGLDVREGWLTEGFGFWFVDKRGDGYTPPATPVYVMRPRGDAS